MGTGVLAIACVIVAALAGCTSPAGEGGGVSDGPSSSGPDDPLRLTSASFEDGGAIPRRHTCDGEEVSPPLDIAGFPAGTVSLAILVKDHDVPTPQTRLRTIDHWAVWRIDPATPDLPEGAVPAGARQAAGGWNGPCPPHASPAHRYEFTLYAVDVLLDVPDGATAADVEAGMQGHVLGTAELVGTYQRALA